jgi:hypothetical protein
VLLIYIIINVLHQLHTFPLQNSELIRFRLLIDLNEQLPHNFILGTKQCQLSQLVLAAYDVSHSSSHLTHTFVLK